MLQTPRSQAAQNPSTSCEENTEDHTTVSPTNNINFQCRLNFDTACSAVSALHFYPEESSKSVLSPEHVTSSVSSTMEKFHLQVHEKASFLFQNMMSLKSCLSNTVAAVQSHLLRFNRTDREVLKFLAP